MLTRDSQKIRKNNSELETELSSKQLTHVAGGKNDKDKKKDDDPLIGPEEGDIIVPPDYQP